MTKVALSEPDYKYWCKFDSWTFKDAALLFHSIDPFNYKNTRFNTKEIPEEILLKEPYKTFLLFKNVFKEENDSYSESAHPYQIFDIATRKEIPVPEKLVEHLKERYAKEKAHQQKIPSLQQQANTASTDNDKELTTRERRTLLKSIGIMAMLLTKSGKNASQFILNGRPNAFRIAEAVITEAQALDISIEGLKSLDRKIKEALEFLEQEEL